MPKARTVTMKILYDLMNHKLFTLSVRLILNKGSYIDQWNGSSVIKELVNFDNERLFSIFLLSLS